MTVCPNCASTQLGRHCDSTNLNCDMIRCRRCKAYGTTTRWASPVKGGNWVTRKLAG